MRRCGATPAQRSIWNCLQMQHSELVSSALVSSGSAVRLILRRAVPSAKAELRSRPTRRMHTGMGDGGTLRTLGTIFESSRLGLQTDLVIRPRGHALTAQM
jgi:hypothetical protein